MLSASDRLSETSSSVSKYEFNLSVFRFILFVQRSQEEESLIPTKRVKSQFLLIPTIDALYEYLNVFYLTVSLSSKRAAQGGETRGCANIFLVSSLNACDQSANSKRRRRKYCKRCSHKCDHVSIDVDE